MKNETIDAESSEPIDLPDGIYFDLDEETYHRLERLSCSGIQSLMVSAGNFWVDSWLNPDRAERDTNTHARILGRLYHTARFEPDMVDKRFVRDLDAADMPPTCLMNDIEVRAAIKEMQPQKEDYPDALFTDTEVKAELKAMGQPASKAGEKAGDRISRLKAIGCERLIWADIIGTWEIDNGPISGPAGESSYERAVRLESYGYDGKIWALEVERFNEALEGRTPIKAMYWDQVIVDMKRIHSNPEIADYVQGGEPEVSILWTCPTTGIKMKSRIDYLKPDMFTDFKTFDNVQRKEIEQLLPDLFRYNRYYIQAALYWQVTEIIRSGELQIQDATKKSQRQLIEKIQNRKHPMHVWYVFQEKNGIPNLYACEFSVFSVHPSHDLNAIGADEDASERAKRSLTDHTTVYLKARNKIDLAKELFLNCKEVYPDGTPWYPLKPIRKVDDGSFSTYWLEE